LCITSSVFLCFFKLGISVGHVYYFLEDVFPNQPCGFKILKTIWILRFLCDTEEEHIETVPEMLEHPGGHPRGRQDGDLQPVQQRQDDGNLDRQ